MIYAIVTKGEYGDYLFEENHDGNYFEYKSKEEAETKLAELKAKYPDTYLEISEEEMKNYQYFSREGWKLD